MLVVSCDWCKRLNILKYQENHGIDIAGSNAVCILWIFVVWRDLLVNWVWITKMFPTDK